MTDEHTCHYCGCAIGDVGNTKGLPERTRDHIVPRARGGEDVSWNRIWCCGKCNVKKSDRWPTCSCNRCRKARRLHWQDFGINEFSSRP
jgi:5-methylcytosine-specific restriction endonuclease McrA